MVRKQSLHLQCEYKVLLSKFGGICGCGIAEKKVDLCIFHCAPPASMFVPDVLGVFDHNLTLSFQRLVGRDLK